MKKNYQIFCHCEASCIKHIEAENFGEALRLAANKTYPIDMDTISEIGKCRINKVRSYLMLQKNVEDQYQEERNYAQRLYLK